MGIGKNTRLLMQICNIYYQYIENINSITNDADGNVVVGFKGIYGWEELYLTKTSIKFEENGEEMDEGYFLTQKLSGNIPGDDNNKYSDYDEIIRHNHIIRVDFDDGNKKIIGTIDNPVKLIMKKMNNPFVRREISFERIGDEDARWLS
jgi:hypothetical protein